MSLRDERAAERAHRPEATQDAPVPGAALTCLSRGSAAVAWSDERNREPTVGVGDGVDQRSDAALLLASRDDPAAFVELYRRHAEDLLRYFARRTLDPEAAAELTAETFAEAFASRARYSYVTGVNGVAWLYGIARHQLGRFFRSGRIDAAARKKIGLPARELPPEDYERIEDLVDFAPLRAALADALETLADDQREALKLRVIDGLPYPEVAARLQCAETAARQRVSRGLRRLALVLQERGLMLTSEVD
jgi:RNA polymerase sigma factor (sigma-70 family)